MKFVLINSDYDEVTGVSKVTIGTSIGEFTGYSHCAVEDQPFASRYHGCSYAEWKARIKASKAYAARAYQEWKTLNDFYKILAGTRTFNPKAYHVRQLLKQMDKKLEERKYYLALAEAHYKGLQSMIKRRDEENAKRKEHNPLLG